MNLKLRIAVPAVLLAAIAASLLSCRESAMSRLDREVERLLDEEHNQTLGAESSRDPQPVPPRLEAGGITPKTYANRPRTDNPLPGELPARPTTQPDIPPTTQPASADSMPGAVPGALPAVTLSLEQALSYAIANAPEYRNRKDELYLTAIEMLVQKHLWGPRFFDTVTAQITGQPGGEAGDSQRAFELLNEFEVQQRLPYGGQISAGVLVSYLDQLRDNASADDERRAELFLTGTLPLLRGAGGTAQEDLLQAERDLVYAAREFETFRRQFLLDVSTRYYDLLRARRENENRQRQLQMFERLTLRTAGLARAGRIAPFEVQRSEQQELTTRNDLINSRERYNLQLDAFKIVIGMPTQQPLDVEPVEIAIPEPELKETESIRTALSYRLDLQNTADRVDDARRRVSVAHNQLLPNLDLFADVRTRNDTEEFPTTLNLDFGEPSYQAGARFGVPLDRRIEKLRYRQTLISHERTRRDYKLAHDRVVQEVRSAIRAIRQAHLTLDLQARNVKVNETRLRGVMLRLRELGTRDITEAQNALLDAQNRYDAALRDLRVSILQYLQATGQLRVTREGRWEPPGRLVAGRAAPETPEAPTPARIIQDGNLNPNGG
jgi:outer membrane protein TolC